jgi:PIN domain nuclease of toxin-antitoxin system
LIAQAMHEDAALVSEDENMGLYAVRLFLCSGA